MSKISTDVGGLSGFFRGYGFPVCCILLSIILLLVSARPTYNRIQELGVERVSVQQRLTVLTEKVRSLETFTVEGVAEQLDTRFEEFDRAVPSERKVPALLTQVQTIAQESGVEIASLQFGGELSADQSEAQSWREVRVKFVPEGSFEQLLSLLRTLELASRVIDVEAISYSVEEVGVIGGEAPTFVTRATLTLIAYYTPEQVSSPETPITFTLDSSTFEQNSAILPTLTAYPE